MDLPVRIVERPPAHPVVSVDGAFDAPGLNLSHWPGHATPRELRHDLSTGAALAFARLPAARRAELAAGARELVNNHYDTDGVCALFAVRHPAAALARADLLLAAARAGDFFAGGDERAFVLDAIVAGVADPERSPLDLAGLAPLERHQRAVEHLLERLPALLDGEVEPYRALWERPLADLRADKADLARCARDELAHLEWTVHTAPQGAVSSRAGAPPLFDPGRHALFETGAEDRALVVGPAAAGATYRLVLNTVSWFELATRAALPRPDLEACAGRLNALEGSAPQAERAWRAQPTASPSPELWFGARDHALFAEHAGDVLAPSALAPAAVRRVLADALRAALPLPA